MTSNLPRERWNQSIETIDLYSNSVADCKGVKPIRVVLLGALYDGSRGLAGKRWLYTRLPLRAMGCLRTLSRSTAPFL
ncbi:hypothetical protein TOC8171_17370 [Pseudomonas syringae]